MARPDSTRTRWLVTVVPLLGALLVGCDPLDGGGGAPSTTIDVPPSVLPGVEPTGDRVDLELVTSDGRARTAHLYVPASLPTEPVPLLVALHGGTGSGEQFETNSGFDRLAEANGFLVVYPDGVGVGPNGTVARTWNGGVCCGRAAADGVDDVAFLRALVAEVTTRYRVDADRVYATGHSNGMIMGYRLACEAADVFTAVAGQAGTLGIDVCAPAPGVSLLHIHGDADANLPIDGGRGDGISDVDFPSPRTGVRAFAAADGCDVTEMVTSDGPATTQRWTACDDGAVVEFVTVAGASHAWMGAPAPARPGAPEPFADYDSSYAVVSFLLAHPRPAG